MKRSEREREELEMTSMSKKLASIAIAAMMVLSLMPALVVMPIAEAASVGHSNTDANPPIVINASANPPIIIVDNEIMKLRADVRDNESLIDNVTIDLSPIGGNANTIMHLVGNYTKDGQLWNIFEHKTNSSVGGIFNLSVNATDIHGNYNNTVSIALEVVPAVVIDPLVKVEIVDEITREMQNITIAGGNWINMSNGIPVRIPGLTFIYDGFNRTSFQVEDRNITIIVDDKDIGQPIRYPYQHHRIYHHRDDVTLTFDGTEHLAGTRIDLYLITTYPAELRNIALAAIDGNTNPFRNLLYNAMDVRPEELDGAGDVDIALGKLEAGDYLVIGMLNRTEPVYEDDLVILSATTFQVLEYESEVTAPQRVDPGAKIPVTIKLPAAPPAQYIFGAVIIHEKIYNVTLTLRSNGTREGTNLTARTVVGEADFDKKFVETISAIKCKFELFNAIYGKVDNLIGKNVSAAHNVTTVPHDNLTITTIDMPVGNYILMTGVWERGTDRRLVAFNQTRILIAPPPPAIVAFAPPSPVHDHAGATRTFNITVNQTANVTWLINGTTVQTDPIVREALYTNISAVVGTWNVSAIASNPNGTDMQRWIWIVTPPPPVVVPPVVVPPVVVPLPPGVTIIPTDPIGRVIESVVAYSPDKIAWATIPEGTIAMIAGVPLTEITIAPPIVLPAPPPVGVIYVGYAYNFGPKGATFNPPIAITIEFDPADFEGRIPVIYRYRPEAGEWERLDTTIVENRATTKVSHFSTFVLFAEEKVVIPPPPPPPPVIPWPLIIGIIIALVIVAVVAYYFYTKRKKA